MDCTKAYALAYLRDIDVNDEVVTYLLAIDETLTPFAGRFLVHGGGDLDGREGAWEGAIVVIEFPDRSAAVAWYESAAYQRILPLRVRNTHSVAVIVDGVPTGYTARDGLPPAAPSP